MQLKPPMVICLKNDQGLYVSGLHFLEMTETAMICGYVHPIVVKKSPDDSDCAAIDIYYEY